MGVIALHKAMRTSAGAVAAVVAVVLAFVGFTAAAAGAQTSGNYSPPSIQVNPPTVVAGQQFTITGSGCQAGETVTFVLNPGGVALGSTTADGNGNYSFTSNFPNVAPGTYT